MIADLHRMRRKPKMKGMVKQLVPTFFVLGASICVVWASFLISFALGLFVLGAMFYILAWSTDKVMREGKEGKKIEPKKEGKEREIHYN